MRLEQPGCASLLDRPMRNPSMVAQRVGRLGLFDHVGWVDHVELRRRVLPSGGQDGRLTTRGAGTRILGR